MTLFFLLKLAHVLAAAVWLAGGLTVPRDIRATLALGKPHTGPLLARVRRAELIGIPSGFTTLATGLALVFTVGGFAHVPIRIHVGLALTLATFLVGGLLCSPTWRAIARLVESDADPPRAQQLARRFTIGFTIEHALRLAALTTMVLPLGTPIP